MAAARSFGVSETDIELAHHGSSANPDVSAIVEVGLRVDSDQRASASTPCNGCATPATVDREITDVIGVVTLNVLTGSFILLFGRTPTSAEIG